MIRKKLGNTCLESRLAASSRPSSDCELLRRFRQQGWKVSSEIQSLGLSASFESCWDTTAPAFHRHHPHRPTTARLPARFPQPAPRGEEARTGLCPPAAAILDRAGRALPQSSVQNSHKHPKLHSPPKPTSKRRPRSAQTATDEAGNGSAL